MPWIPELDTYIKKLNVCYCSKQVHMRMTEHLADGIEHLGKKGTLSGKDLV